MTQKRAINGFTLIELLMAVAILGIVVGIAIPLYQGYAAEARINHAIKEMLQVEILIVDFCQSNGTCPDTLSEVGAGSMIDPWGRPYQYLNIADGGSAAKGRARKDKFLVPVNSDFDLYSLGEDGESSSPFTAKQSRDDVVRANNGAFYGLAADY